VRNAALAAFVLVAGSAAGCDCIGCSKTKAGTTSGKDWSLEVVCESTTRLGGAGAGHGVGILYPDGCDVEWRVRARGRPVDLPFERVINGTQPADHECSKTKAFCEQTKVDIDRAITDDAATIAVAAGGSAHLIYILQPGRPFEWTDDDDDREDVRDARAHGDTARLLALAPSPDDALWKLLKSGRPLAKGIEQALTGPRLERHFGEVKSAAQACSLSDEALTVVARQRAEIVNDAYDGWSHDPSACRRYPKWLAHAAPPPPVVERLERDLAACTEKCDPTRLEALASMADGFGSPRAIGLLVPHMHAPTREEWIAARGHTEFAFDAWYACGYAVARHDPGTARSVLIAELERASTRALPYFPPEREEAAEQDDAGAAPDAGAAADADGMGDAGDAIDQTDLDEGDAGDAGDDLEEGVLMFDIVPRRPDGVTPAMFYDTAPSIAELLMLVDDPSVRDRMNALARDPTRDRGVRQVAIGYLAAVRDKRARDLADSDVLTEEQRASVKRTLFGAPAASSSSSSSSSSASPSASPSLAPPRRRHRHHRH
jgi:hypothetical protein